MLEKKFNIPGVINCELKYLTDPSLVNDSNAKDVLKAICKPLNMITHNQALNFSFEYVKVVLDELKKLESEHAIFYDYFDIDYNKYNVGPTLGQNGIALSFEIKPTITLKNLTGGGFIDEKDK